MNNAGPRRQLSGGGGVREPPAERYGRSLSSMLLELVMVCLYGDPERHAATVPRCVMDLDAVPLTAPTRTADGSSCGRIEPHTGPRWRPGEAR